MALIGDLILQTANAPGTSTFNLIAPVAGRTTFITGAGAGQVYYYAHDGTNWEKGYGTLTAGAPDTLSRDTVLKNSLGTTAKINFVATVQLYSDIPAERAIGAAADNASVPIGNRVLTGLAAGAGTSDSVRYDQVSGIRTATAGVTTAFMFFPISTTDPYLIEFRNMVPTTASQFYFRLSLDGGATFRSTAGDYNSQLMDSVNATAPSSAASIGATFASLTGQTVTAASGEVFIDPTVGSWRSRITGANSVGNLFQSLAHGTWSFGTPNYFVISSVAGSNLTAGALRGCKRNFV